jgi:hypothetical protein
MIFYDNEVTKFKLILPQEGKICIIVLVCQCVYEQLVKYIISPFSLLWSNYYCTIFVYINLNNVV